MMVEYTEQYFGAFNKKKLDKQLSRRAGIIRWCSGGAAEDVGADGVDWKPGPESPPIIRLWKPIHPFPTEAAPKHYRF